MAAGSDQPSLGNPLSTPTNASVVAPVVAIVGETASGKSALALELAQQFNGEIICADSRTIYKGMDIGTAKPTTADQAWVPHYLLDVIAPDQTFSAAAFQQQTEQAIAGITARGKVPFLVGGTGLYIDSVMYQFSFRQPADPAVRAELATKTVEELQALLEERGIPLPENAHNPRHLIRALETNGEIPVKGGLRPYGLMLGLQIERDQLRANIEQRIEAMLEVGFLEEVKRLANRYGWDAPGMQAPGYKTFQGYFTGEASLEECKARFVQSHIQLAKRQRTWFKRNPDIYYIYKKAEAVDLITTLLNNCYTASR